ncbi:hypothetical protein GCM10022246_18050 [Pedobacter ginsengiterrae]|uniref:Uncharacterized protein n=1 Tax=Pedobacter ginsengiterrae TaxID=871696 RepID=A0ABP7PGP0_9SPHI
MPEYQDFAERLIAEWKSCLNLDYSQKQWDVLNLEMLLSHEYFATYGRTALQKKKAVNIEKLRLRIG